MKGISITQVDRKRLGSSREAEDRTIHCAAGMLVSKFFMKISHPFACSSSKVQGILSLQQGRSCRPGERGSSIWLT